MSRAPDPEACQNKRQSGEALNARQRVSDEIDLSRADHKIHGAAANLAGKILRLQGWHRYALAFVAGLSSVLAMAPFFVSPILFVTLPCLVWLIDGAVRRDSDKNENENENVDTDFDSNTDTDTDKNAKTPNAKKRHQTGAKAIASRLLLHSSRHHLRAAFSAALIGWWFAFGYFLAGLYWIGSAFLVEADTFAWLLPFAVTLMPAGLALFWAAAIGVAALIWQPGLQRVMIFAVSLSGFEWLRGHILTGFPWNVPGYALSYPLVLMQSAGLVGIYGLTLIALIVFAAPLVIWFEQPRSTVAQDQHPPQQETFCAHGICGHSVLSRLMLAVTIAGLPLAAMALYGWQRLAEPLIPPPRPVTVRIVQPSVIQSEKWQPRHQTRIFNQHLALSKHNAAGQKDDLRGTKLLIWPEAAMPFLPLRKPAALSAIAKLLPKGTMLLAGALRMEDRNRELPWSRRQVFNSALLFGAQGKLLAHYDKTHLVPFGEYLPFQETLEAIGLEQLTRLRGGFSTGPTPRPLITAPGLPNIGVLICYEVIFPGVVAQATARPDFLVNLTNDGWFGNSTGPRQHLHQARVRAVEEGLPLIRAANNGISAVIDPYGRIIRTLDIDETGVIDVQIPQKIASPAYGRYGDIVFTIMWLICLTFSLVGFYHSSRSKTSSPLN